MKGHYLFAKLTVHRGRYEMFDVDYAVHEDDPVVFVRSLDFRLPSGFPTPTTDDSEPKEDGP